MLRLESWWPAKGALLALLLAGSGCVLKSGGGKDLDAGPTGPPPSDFSGVVDRTRNLIDNTDDADTRSRLDALWDFASEADTLETSAQEVVLHYLERLVTIEERITPVEMPLAAGIMTDKFGTEGEIESAELAGPEALPAPPAPVVEVELLQPDPEELGGPPADAPMPPTAPPPPAMPTVDVEAVLAEGARQVELGDAIAAMGIYEVCAAQPCWPAVEAAHTEARDMHVFARKEACTVRFLELRGEPSVQVQRDGLQQILEELSMLRAAFPDSQWAGELASQISRVQRELESLPED